MFLVTPGKEENCRDERGSSGDNAGFEAKNVNVENLYRSRLNYVGSQNLGSRQSHPGIINAFGSGSRHKLNYKMRLIKGQDAAPFPRQKPL